MDNCNVLCVLCCCSFSKNAGDADGDDDEAVHLREKLTEFINLCDKSPLLNDKRCSVPTIVQLNDCLNGFESSALSVCSECINFVNAALENSSKADEIEKEVRALQEQLLRQLRILERQIGLFAESMKDIGGIIKNSDEIHLCYHLGQKGKAIHEREVLSMRAKIMDGVTHLQNHQLQHHSDVDNPNTFKEEMIISAANVKIEEDSASDMPVCGSSIYLENFVKIEVTADGGDGDSIFHHEGDEDIFFPVEEDGSDVMEDDQDESNFITATLEEFAPNSYNNHPVGRTRQTKIPLERNKEDKNILAIIDKMPPFKQMVVRRAYKRENNSSHNEHIMRYDFQLGELLVGNVSVKMHEIQQTLSCSKCQFTGKPPKKGNIKQITDLEKRMREHIVGSHLGGFKCPFCDKVTTSKTCHLEHLREVHKESKVRKMRKLDSLPKPHKCTICKYSTNKPSDLRRHLKVHEKRGQL